MRVTTLLNRLLHLPGLWVDRIEFDDEVLVIHVQQAKNGGPALGSGFAIYILASKAKLQNVAVVGSPVSGIGNE